MIEIYEVEIECKKGNRAFVRNAIVSGMLGDTWIAPLCAKVLDLNPDTVVVYLSDGTDLLDMWEIRVDAQDCYHKVRNALGHVKKSIERKEAKAYA